MKKLFASTIVSLVLVIAPSVIAQDFNKGFTAAQSGDFATALREWKPLAEQGVASAQFNLGFMYGEGQGVLQDHMIAHMWENLAAAQGNKPAAKNREITAKKMTPADLSIAQRLARECLARNYKNCGR